MNLKHKTKRIDSLSDIEFGKLPLPLRMGLFPYFVKALGFFVAMKMLFREKKK